MPHLLVTNDFPPKLGGIQSYLYELWRRLPPEMATIYTTAYAGALEFDAANSLRTVRSSRSLLLPSRQLRTTIGRLADETSSGLVVLDPAVPLGTIGPWLGRPYGVVLHGAEVTVPGRLPGSRRLLAQVLTKATWIIAAGGYPAAEASRVAGPRLPPVTEVPPGVDTNRFRPLDAGERLEARGRFGLPADALVVVSICRLVPRKGMDVLIRAFARLRRTRRHLALAIGGEGRDLRRLRGLASEAGVHVHWLGRIPEADLPLAYGCADVYAMCCRDRWLGLEQEGFGIVFLEAAACGLPQVAGSSGGSAEAVADGATGLVVERPRDVDAVAEALAALVDDADLRSRLGQAARQRAVSEFDYDRLALRLEQALVEAGG